MAKEPKEYEWLRRNSKYLNKKTIADDIGMSYRLLAGYANEQSDGHGTPYKIPEKNKAKLVEIIKKIRDN